MLNDNEKPVNLGTCCICERAEGVRNIGMLSQRAPIPGHGWGCVVCGLPADGATVVLCDDCFASLRAGTAEIRFACKGWAGTEGRVPVEQLDPEPFKHDPSKHVDASP
jgi:hypothetical protein